MYTKLGNPNSPSMPTTLLPLSGVNGRKINILPNQSPEAITDLIHSIVSANPLQKEPFYVLDLGLVLDLFRKWTTSLSEEVTPLLIATRSAGLDVIGVSFHVRSGATNFQTYNMAIASARAVFDTADQLTAQRMNAINIGDGFTAGDKFDEAVEVIKSSINHFFSSDQPDLKRRRRTGRRPKRRRTGPWRVEMAVMLRTSAWVRRASIWKN